MRGAHINILTHITMTERGSSVGAESQVRTKRAEAKNAIHTYLRSLIKEGLIRNREDVLAALRDAALRYIESEKTTSP